jgi:hypothetical protein
VLFMQNYTKVDQQTFINLIFATVSGRDRITDTGKSLLEFRRISCGRHILTPMTGNRNVPGQSTLLLMRYFMKIDE